MKPLNVGNVVSAGLRIYRDHFSEYFRIALIGYFWILVPVYGWAKFAGMMGLLSRLAFGEVTEKPESIKDANRHIKPKIWSFLGGGILITLIIYAAIIPFSILLGILVALSGFIFSLNSALGAIFGIVFGIGGICFFFYGLVWLMSRLFLFELPLGVEENVNATRAIGRSWQLVKGSVGRIQLTILLAFLISAPLTIVIQIISAIIQGFLGAVASSDGTLNPISFIAVMLISIPFGALLIPFWQSIKAVIYYDLRVRREGLGMKLRE